MNTDWEEVSHQQFPFLVNNNFLDASQPNLHKEDGHKLS